MRKLIIPYGTTRIIKKFAWFEVKVSNYNVWLEFYWEKQEWTQGVYINHDYWHTIEKYFSEER